MAGIAPFVCMDGPAVQAAMNRGLASNTRIGIWRTLPDTKFLWEDHIATPFQFQLPDHGVPDHGVSDHGVSDHGVSQGKMKMSHSQQS